MSSGLAHHPRTSFRIDDILPPKQDTVLGEVAGGLGAFQLPQQLLHGYHGAGNVPGSLASTLSLCVSPQAYQNLWFPTFGHNATSYPRWLCSGGRMDGNTSVVIPTPDSAVCGGIILCPSDRGITSRGRHQSGTALQSISFHMPPFFQSAQSPNDSSSEMQNIKQCRRRKARTVFSDNQLNGLEKRFETQRYLSTPERVELANHLSLSETQVKTWFKHKKLLRKQKDETSCGRPHLLVTSATGSPCVDIEAGGVAKESGRPCSRSSSGSDLSAMSSVHSGVSINVQN